MKEPTSYHGKYQNYIVARIILIVPSLLVCIALPWLAQLGLIVIVMCVLGVLISLVVILFSKVHFVKTLTIGEEGLYIDTGQGQLTFEFDELHYVNTSSSSSSLFDLYLRIGRRGYCFSGIDFRELRDCRYAIDAAIWHHRHSE